MRVPVIAVSRVEPPEAATVDDAAHRGQRRPMFPRMLDKRLQHLVNNQVRTLPISALVDRRIPAGGTRCMCLTFDGGWSSHAEHVLPILRRLGLRATFFVPPHQLDRRGHLTGAQLERLARAGMHVGVELPTADEIHALPPSELQRILTDARRLLEMRIGQPIRTVACLGPPPERSFLRRLRSYGYSAICSGEPGNHFEIGGVLCIARRELLPSTPTSDWLEVVRLDHLSHHGLGFYLPEQPSP